MVPLGSTENRKIAVLVGSTRKPKLDAVTEALEQIGPELQSAGFQVVGREVASGVNPTPASREDSMKGARQRAEALMRLSNEEGQRWDFFVGLEGGLDLVSENSSRRVFLESWAFVSDGNRGYFGRSGAVELPETLARRVLVDGTELSEAIDQFAGETGVRNAQGAWGVLSLNRITRQEAFRIAVIAAFAPFYNARMYEPPLALKSV